MYMRGMGIFEHSVLFKKTKENITEVVFIAIMFFFAAWSMEQVGFATIVIIM